MTDSARVAAPTTSDEAGRALRGFDLVQSDPVAAQQVLTAVIRSRRSTARARVIALWGLGRLAIDGGRVDEALTSYRDAVSTALDTGYFSLAAEVRVSWAGSLQAHGDHLEAMVQLDLAEPALSGGPLGRLQMQRGALYTFLGDREAAVRQYDLALPLLLTSGDELAATRLISNRAIAHAQLGHTTTARNDFLRSQLMAEQLGQHVLAAGALHNLAYLDGRVGDFPKALRGFAAARERYAHVGSPGRYVGDLDIDECSVLIEVGLGAEAEKMATLVVESSRSSGNVAQLADALVSLARSRLLVGEHRSAEAAALEAAALSAATRSKAGAAIARYWATVAGEAHGSGHTSAARQIVRLRAVADDLDRHGWASEAAEVRVLTGRRALESGRTELARQILSAAAIARRHPLARVRAEAWHAAALLALADGDRRVARRAIMAGLGTVDLFRATLGAIELRSRAGRLGEPLALLGMKLALEVANPIEVLRWAERWRASSLGDAPADNVDTADSSDTCDARALEDLRGARLELADRQTSQSVSDPDAMRRLSDLEAAVARRARHRQGRPQTAHQAVRITELREALGQNTLVEFIEHDGQLQAVLVGPAPPRLVAIGSTAATIEANEHLAFALRRLVRMSAGPAAQRHAAAVDLAAGHLDRLLFGPMRDSFGAGGLVVVPTGALHSVLWGALPTAHRTGGLAIAPSAKWWLREAPPPRRRSVLLVAGPDLAHATTEVAALRRMYPTARVLSGSEASVQAVGEAIESSTLVHIAAHGEFRQDNPLFSSLRLHDGSLFVHDLNALRRLPHTVVLTACSSGRNGVLPGDELLGTSAALMGLGVRALAAPLVPISDVASVPVAVALHRGLRSGLGLAAAMAGCVRHARRSAQVDVSTAAISFNCIAGRR